LSAYHADSHAAWADWLTATFTRIDWQVLTLPGRHFAWRIRGNPLSWLDELPTQRPDLILATSMVDLATLKGLHPLLHGVPCWLYFHENQFAYPQSQRQFRSLDPCMVQLYGALAADRVLFNSRFNRDSFLDGVKALIKRLPDHQPEGLRARLETRSDVLPVPIEPIKAGKSRDHGLIVWNHRWEYDKAPERFAAAMLALDRLELDFRLALLGKRSEKPPEPLVRLRQCMGQRIVADGHLPRPDYEALLSTAGIVVSTAVHEFQGLSVLEAASAGARPLVPDALCYPEQYPDPYRYDPNNEQALVDRLTAWLTGTLPARFEPTDWLASTLSSKWAALLDDATNRRG
jgi:glycosyltransferase involved in cell wall biosynthesis